MERCCGKNSCKTSDVQRCSRFLQATIPTVRRPADNFSKDGKRKQPMTVASGRGWGQRPCDSDRCHGKPTISDPMYIEPCLTGG